MKIGDNINTKIGRFVVIDIVGDLIQIEHEPIDGGYLVTREFIKEILIDDEQTSNNSN